MLIERDIDEAFERDDLERASPKADDAGATVWYPLGTDYGGLDMADGDQLNLDPVEHRQAVAA